MSERLQPLVTAKGRARLVPFGPAGDRLPARFTGELTYPDRSIRVVVDASFNGTDRVRADSVTVTRTDGASVAPADMGILANAMRNIVSAAINYSPKVPIAQSVRGRRAGPPDEDELLALAQFYWRDFVSWGNPRQTAMNAFQLPRSTANYWIRKAREQHALPGPHSHEES